MSQQAVASPADEAAPRGATGMGVYNELFKARLSALVVMTTAAGAFLASGGSVDWALLGWTVLGTSLAAASANAWNQIIEADLDAQMRRTAGRPMPSGRMSVPHAMTVAVLTGGFGVTILAATSNLLTAGLGLAALLIYVLAYTPLKTRTTLNTMVGAVVGAIPPIMGWTAVTGTIDPGAWALGALLLVWQIPHFLALAWMYRKDYAAAGFKMLPAIDPSGSITAQAVLLWSLALIPVAAATSIVGATGAVYAVGAIVLGLWMLREGFRLHGEQSDANARRVFLASVIYLPLLLALMGVDRLLTQGIPMGPEAWSKPTPVVSPHTPLAGRPTS